MLSEVLARFIISVSPYEFSTVVELLHFQHLAKQLCCSSRYTILQQAVSAVLVVQQSDARRILRKLFPHARLTDPLRLVSLVKAKLICSPILSFTLQTLLLITGRTGVLCLMADRNLGKNKICLDQGNSSEIPVYSTCHCAWLV